MRPATGIDGLDRHDDLAQAEAKAQAEGKGQLWTACAETPTPIPVPTQTPFEESGDESMMPPTDPGPGYRAPTSTLLGHQPDAMFDELLNDPVQTGEVGSDSVMGIRSETRELFHGVQTGIIFVDLKSTTTLRFFVMESAEAAESKILEDSASLANVDGSAGEITGRGALYPVPQLPYPARAALRNVSESSHTGVIYCWAQVGNVVVYVVIGVDTLNFERDLAAGNIYAIQVLLGATKYVERVQGTEGVSRSSPGGSGTVLATVNDDDVWLRSGPSVNAPGVRLLSRGATFQVSGVENGPFPDGDGGYWWLVSDGTVESIGFIDAEFLDVTGY